MNAPSLLILNVNDQDDVRYLTSRMLEQAGYTIVDASTGAEAIELVEKLRLRDTAVQLQQVNKRTHEFLAMLAHELRNPLSAIITCIPLLERRPPRDEIETSVWQILRRQTGNLRCLVEDLLDTARVTQGKIEPKWEVVELAALLRRVTGGLVRTLLEMHGGTVLARSDGVGKGCEIEVALPVLDQQRPASTCTW